MAQCDSCFKKYKEAFPGGEEHNQGWKCAATVTDESIIGHYGSTVADMEEYVWVTRPDNIVNGNICDDCLEVLINLKHIEFKRRSGWL